MLPDLAGIPAGSSSITVKGRRFYFVALCLLAALR